MKNYYMSRMENSFSSYSYHFYYRNIYCQKLFPVPIPQDRVDDGPSGETACGVLSGLIFTASCRLQQHQKRTEPPDGTSSGYTRSNPQPISPWATTLHRSLLLGGLRRSVRVRTPDFYIMRMAVKSSKTERQTADRIG